MQESEEKWCDIRIFALDLACFEGCSEYTKKKGVQNIAEVCTDYFTVPGLNDPK